MVEQQAINWNLKRRFPRRGFPRIVGLLNRGSYRLSKGVEIGEGGMSLSLDQALVVGEKVVVNFQIPNSSFVSIIAEIRGVFKRPDGKWNHGMEFINIKFENKREIRMFVSSRTEQEDYSGQKDTTNAALKRLLRNRSNPS